MAKGWISLHRKLSENDLWLSEKFTRGQAWVDMIMLANHKDGFIRVRGKKIDLKRGQLGWSEVNLSKRWGWSRGKIKRFISELENEQQIVQQKNNITSIITIVNYKYYQSDSTADDTANRTTNGQQLEQQTDSKQDTNNNGNNEDNDNNVNKKEKKILKKEFEKDVLEIYEAYPGRCPIQNRSLGKSQKDKDKIQKLLKSGKTKEELLKIIEIYLSDCVKANSYTKNFLTFLNNLPDLKELTSQEETLPSGTRKPTIFKEFE